MAYMYLGRSKGQDANLLGGIANSISGARGMQY